MMLQKNFHLHRLNIHLGLEIKFRALRVWKFRPINPQLSLSLKPLKPMLEAYCIKHFQCLEKVWDLGLEVEACRASGEASSLLLQSCLS